MDYLLASIFRWTRPMFAFSTAMACWFARARRRRRQRRLSSRWRKRQVVVASFSRRANGQILFHGLNQLGLPVVCLESRQAYHALKSLATHKDRPRKRSRARPEAAPPWSPTLGHRPRGLGGSVACSFVLGVAAVTIETAYCEQETRH